MKQRTIADRWQETFRMLRMEKAPPEVQRLLRRVFYIGFQEAMLAHVELAEDDASDDIGASRIKRLHDESDAFGRLMQEGKA